MFLPIHCRTQTAAWSVRIPSHKNDISKQISLIDYLMVRKAAVNNVNNDSMFSMLKRLYENDIFGLGEKGRRRTDFTRFFECDFERISNIYIARRREVVCTVIL